MGLVFLLLIGVSLLGFTHQGNKWLWQQAKGALPSLKGELVAGQLGYGWTLEGVGWQDELVDVTVERAVLDWDLGKLLQGKLWIKSLNVTHPVVKVADSEPTPEEPSEPFVWHPLPLKIQVDSLQVADLDVTVPGVGVSLKSLDIGATLSRKGLIVQGPVLDGLKVTLAETQATEAAKPAAAKASSQDKAAAKSPVTAKAKPADESKAQKATNQPPSSCPPSGCRSPSSWRDCRSRRFAISRVNWWKGSTSCCCRPVPRAATSRCASSPCATPWRIWRSRARSSSKTITRSP